MKGLFKPKPRTPVELVRQVRALLIYADSNTETRESKREEKMSELSKLILEMRTVLYGNGESEPVSEACSQLTQEFFREDTLRLLIICLPKLNLGARQDATHVVANLQRQWVNSRLIASDYLEKNLELMDILVPGSEFKRLFYLGRQIACQLLHRSRSNNCLKEIAIARLSLFLFYRINTSRNLKGCYILGAKLPINCCTIAGYEDSDIALSYGAILRKCIRHQIVARYVLESEHMRKFFHYIQLPNFDIASDATATFKELLTRHKSTVADFLSRNFDWFFQEYNSQLLESQNYVTRRHAVKLLGDMLLDRSNSAVMIRYVSSLDNMRILMNLLRDSNKTIQLDAFHVFKLFAANQNKPPEIVGVLITNRTKLLRFFGDFNIDREDDQFEADKGQVVREIASLEPLGDDLENLMM